MDHVLVEGLIGKQIFGQHGREIGVVTDFAVDLSTWQIKGLEVKLNRETLDDLNLKRSWIGTQTIQVPTTEISGASDTFILKHTLEEMEFSGGTPASAEPVVDANELTK
jgi:sporulation protein YlmC with PRC-barrel domain